jgi:uncharacterized protein (TIGR02391 family)
VRLLRPGAPARWVVALSAPSSAGGWTSNSSPGPTPSCRKLDQAVFASMKAVEVRVRKLAGLGDDLVGVKLMTRAFGPGGQLTDPAAPPGEQEGTRAMFAGIFAVLRNPAGHCDVDYSDVSEAAEAVQTASLLMRILDRAEERLVAVGRTAKLAAQPTPTS